MGGLQVVEQEVSTVAYSHRDTEETAVLGAAVEELPGGAGRKLLNFPRLGQRAVLQGKPHWGLGPTAVHLKQGRESERKREREERKKMKRKAAKERDNVSRG